MHWLLIGYIFLFIERPFEIWPILGDLHVERVYIGAVFVYWLAYPGKRWIANYQHGAYLVFAMAVAACWVMSPWADQGQVVVENWFKILFFYLLMVTSVHDAKGLKLLAFGFMTVMAIYMLHSLKEYLGGRHTYRMGIVRLLGVDSSMGDPNSFGGSIVFSLPFLTAFWNGVRGKWVKAACLGYVALASGCILLTGSRSSLLGLVLWGSIVILRSRYRFAGLGAMVLIAPLMFFALPESLQTRFETIINPEVGPANAKESGEGRIEGFLKGMDLIMAYPATGVGPGSWRPATGSKLESHNLYGQLCGEMGLLGVMTFGAILACFAWNGYWFLTRSKAKAKENPFPHALAGSVMMSVFLLLFMGNFGHNLFRHNWLWYGGFLIIARHVAAKQVAPVAKSLALRYPHKISAWRVRVGGLSPARV